VYEEQPEGSSGLSATNTCGRYWRKRYSCANATHRRNDPGVYRLTRMRAACLICSS
jgi:hypothetical protein